MKIRLWLFSLLPLAAACSGPAASLPEIGSPVVRHRPAGQVELLAGDVAATGRDAREGEWQARLVGRDGTAILVTVSHPLGPEENAPVEEYSVELRDGWVESVSEPRYGARSHDLEEAVTLVARRAAASPTGLATLALAYAVLSGQRTEQRCLVDVRARSLERQELFSRVVNVCP